MSIRIFVVEGREYPDPDPALTVEDVRHSLANYFPELANATTSERKDGEREIFTFQKTVGTKGG